MLALQSQQEREGDTKPLPPRVTKCLATSRDLIIIGPMLDAVRRAATAHIQSAIASSSSTCSSVAPSSSPKVLSRWHLLLLASSVRRAAFVTCESYADLMRESLRDGAHKDKTQLLAQSNTEESFPLRMQSLNLLSSNIRVERHSDESRVQNDDACCLLPRSGDAAQPPFALRVLRIGLQVSRSVRDEMAMLEKQTPLSVSAPFFKLLFASLYFCLASPYGEDTADNSNDRRRSRSQENDDNDDDASKHQLQLARGEDSALNASNSSSANPNDEPQDHHRNDHSPSPLQVPPHRQQAQGLVRAATLFAKMGDSDFDEAVRDSAVASDNFTLDPKGALREALTRFYFQLIMSSGDLGSKHGRLLHATHIFSPADQYQLLNVAVSPPAHLKKLRDALLRDFSTFLSLANSVIRCIKAGLTHNDQRRGESAAVGGSLLSASCGCDEGDATSRAAYKAALEEIARRITASRPTALMPSNVIASSSSGLQRPPASATRYAGSSSNSRPATSGDANNAATMHESEEEQQLILAQHRDVLSPNYRIRYGLRHPVIVPKVDNDALMQNLRTAKVKCELETSKQMSRLAGHDDAVEKGKTVSARRHELLTMTTTARCAAVTKIVSSFHTSRRSSAASAERDLEGMPAARGRTVGHDESIVHQLEEKFEHDITDYTVLKGAPRGAHDKTAPVVERQVHRGVSELPDLFTISDMVPTWESESHGYRRPSQQVQPFTYMAGSANSSTALTLTAAPHNRMSSGSSALMARAPPSRGFEQLHDFHEYVGLVEKQRLQLQNAEAERRRVADRKREVYLRSLPNYVQVFLR